MQTGLNKNSLFNYGSVAIFILFFTHQFFFYNGISHSFSVPKWAVFSSLLILLCPLILLKSRENKRRALAGSSQLVVLGISGLVFIASDYFHETVYIWHTLGILSYGMLCLLYWRICSENKIVWAETLCWSMIISGLLEYLDILPFYQGSQYHFSGLSGNPNLFAASLLFWYWLAKDGKRKPVVLTAFVGILLIITLSRSAILVFLSGELYELLRKRTKSRNTAVVIVSGTVLFLAFAFYNPLHLPQFSKLGVRALEIKLTGEAILRHGIYGVGQNGFRKAFCESMYPVSDEVIDSYKDGDDLVYRRINSVCHFTPGGIVLYLGIPLSLLWFSLVGWLFYKRRSFWSFYEKMAMGSMVILSLVYFVFSTSLVLLPFLFIFMKGFCNGEVEQDSGGMNKILFLIPIPGILLWCWFWTGQMKHEYARVHCNSADAYEELLKSYFVSGQDYYDYALYLLNTTPKKEQKMIHKLLDRGFVLMPDPSRFLGKVQLEWKLGNKELAAAYLRDGISHFPTHAPFYYHRALMSQNPEEQIRNYELAVMISYDHVSSWKNLAIVLMEQGIEARRSGDLKKAVAFLTRSLDAFEKALIYFRRYKLEIASPEQYREQLLIGRNTVSKFKKMIEEKNDQAGN